jgi:pimeloyl-ACP methyl ester carboxylesterase
MVESQIRIRSKRVLVPNSGHGIPVDAPDAVISAVREIVTTVRDDLH